MSKVLVDREWLKQLHRDLDACQKVIWSGLRGADPAYCQDAQVRLKEIDELLAQPAEVEGVERWNGLKLAAEVAEEDGPWEPRLGMTDCETAFAQSAGPTKVLELIAALSAVTAERDRLQKKWARVESERDKLRAELETVKKVAYGNLELLDENAKLRAEVEPLRALLGKSLPVVEAHAGASHMLEGFRPTRNKWDELVDGIRAAMAAKEA